MLVKLQVAAHNALTQSFMRPGMDHTCARAALLEAQPSLAQQRLAESRHEGQPDRHYHHQLQGHHYRSPTFESFIDSASNLRHQHPQHQQSQQYHAPEMAPYSHLVNEGIGMGPNPAAFDAPCQQEKEKPVLVHNTFPDQHLSTSPANTQLPYKHSEEASCSSKACIDGLFQPPYHENTLISTEGRYSHHHSSTLKDASILGQPRLKVLCSIGGKIMARPVDGMLRYCGGETRIIKLNQGMSYKELMTKVAMLYGHPVMIKYQLPGEDLDALVSVSSEEDLQNMLEEYDKLVSTNDDARPQIFLFNHSSVCESIDCGATLAAIEYCSDVMNQYVDAVNLVPEHIIGAHCEDRYNDVVVRPKKSVVSNDRMAGPSFPVKPCPKAPSAQSSVPSSPSVASWQAHMKQGPVVDTYLHFSQDQLNLASPMKGSDIGTHGASQDVFLDTSKFDPQSQIVVESPRKQCDVSSSRGEALRILEPGQHVGEVQGGVIHHCMPHLGIGTGRSMQTFGISGSQCEPPCMNQSKQFIQSSTAFTSQVQMEVNFHRPEATQPCHLEMRKQLPGIHTSHQAVLPFHNEGLASHHRGLTANPVYAMRSAPSSPRDAGVVKCSCNQHHVQVHRGISVSFGEPSHMKRSVHLPDQYIRKHGSPLVSRFSDNSSHYCMRVPHPVESDQESHTWKQTCDFIRPVCHHAECWVNKIAHDCDPHSFKEPSHVLHDLPIHRCCCGGHLEWEGQHAHKGLDLPMSTGFHEYIEHHLAPRGGVELDGANVGTTGKSTFQGHKGELTEVRCCMGPGVLNVHDEVIEALTPSIPANCASLSESLQVFSGCMPLRQEGSDCNPKLASFSSTDAVAGSMSMPPDESLVWLNSQPSAAHDKSSRDKSTMPPGSDLMAWSQEANSLLAVSPYFSGNSSLTKGVPIDKPGGETCETRTQHMPLTQIPVHNSSRSRASCSQAVQYLNNSAGFSGPHPPPFPNVGATTFEGPSITLASPVYDRSPVSSINAATFSFNQGKEIVPGNNTQDDKETTLQIGVAVEGSVTTSSIVDFQATTNDQSVECGTRAGDGSTSKLSTLELGPLECSRSQAPLLQKQCSMEGATHVPTVQPAVVDEVGHEGGYEEEEVPANEAEAEAIARGLQIIKNDDLEDLRELGSGTYGTVFHGKWRGSDVAIKRIKASCFTGHPSTQERLISDFWREAATLSQLHHPNVVAFYGVVPDGPGGTLATVTEFMVNGSLKQVLVKKDRTIDRRKRLLIAMDAAFGMEYLHSRKIVHFDLKSENLLVNMRDAHRPICKVGDLGLSKVKHQTLVSGGVRGTLPWMAPELLSGNGLVTDKVDVYSFAIVMWELLTGEEPYANMRCPTIIGGIVNSTLRPTIPSWCDPNWRELMERCWSGDPADRPAFSEVASELRSMAQSLMNIK